MHKVVTRISEDIYVAKISLSRVFHTYLFISIYIYYIQIYESFNASHVMVSSRSLPIKICLKCILLKTLKDYFEFQTLCLCFENFHNMLSCMSELFRTSTVLNLNKLRIFQVLFPIRLPTRSRFRGRSVHRGRSTDAQGKNTSRAADADDDILNASMTIHFIIIIQKSKEISDHFAERC